MNTNKTDYEIFVENVWNEGWFEYMASKNGNGLENGNWCRGDNPNVTMEMIQTYKNYLWNWNEISKNPNISIKYILEHNRFPQYIWNFEHVSENPNLTLDDVLQNINKKWNWNRLSKHKNITLDMILAHPELQWNYNFVCRNPNVTMEMIEQHPEIKWNLENACSNPNITFDATLRTPHHLTYIIANSPIKFSDIVGHPEIDWNRYRFNIRINSNVGMDVIEQFLLPSYKINEHDYAENTWQDLSSCQNITMEFIAKYADKNWKYSYLCRYSYAYDKQKYVNDVITDRKNTLVNAIHEYYKNDEVCKTLFNPSNAEMVFFDDYICSLILKY